jgi:DNA-binding MarR family transcriptional regulator
LIGVLLVKDGQTQTELANVLEIHKVSVGIYINELEALGLLERRQHPTDRRAKCIFLTPLLHATKHIGVDNYNTIHNIATEGIGHNAYLAMLDSIEVMRNNLQTQDKIDRETIDTNKV